jgi:DNA-binding MarR family transcriptional regulator
MNDNFHKELEFIKRELKCRTPDWAVHANRSIFHAAIAIEASVNKKHSKYGLALRGIAILYLLVENNGKIPQKNISKVVNRTKQAVTSALANLERRHLITRETGGRDLRRRVVRITEKGLKVAKESLPLREQSYNSFTSSMSKEEGQQLSAILDRLSKSIIADMKKSGDSR